ncbi:MAG: hypothetical protein DRN57_03755 [Thermoplasmata archaeon]|nr:MAG: hypothetical protein DRN57_03755 [Thermoplasmata archaeon]
MKKMPVTSGDRVLIHLLETRPDGGWVGGVSDQDLISSMCGIGRTHVTRTLKPLIEDGLVDERSGRRPERSRRVKVYSLTEKGTRTALSLTKKVRSMKMRWTDESGAARTGSMERCLSEINSHLTSKSMRAIPLSLLASLPFENLSWNDVLWTSASLGRMEEHSLTLKGWRPVDFRSQLEGSPFSRAVLDSIDEMLKSGGLIIIAGPEGYGKNDLIWHWARSRKKKTLFLEKAEDRDSPIEGGPYDVVVLTGGADPAPGELLLGEMTPSDPRGGDWPPDLKKIPLIMTTSFEGEVDGPVIRAHGISRDHFLKRLREKGLDDELSILLFDASRGGADVLKYVLGLGSGEIEELMTKERDEAVLSILASSRVNG